MTGQTSDTQYWVALNRIPGIGRARYQRLEKHFGRMENAWSATAGELRAAGLDERSTAARGRAAIAHRAALERGGRAVAVMACGLDIVYPPEHLKLAQEVREAGALVSDYPLGTQPRGEAFPRRNRIMSGLSLGVLVVEGDVKSGAMITAGLALEQDREVFAVPGSIFSPQSRGTDQLLQEGAELGENGRDVVGGL